jgi:endonuclease YncB( thermonuclease family)
MGSWLLVMAASVVLTGHNEIPGFLVDVIDPGTLQVKTQKGFAEIRVLGMQCPRMPKKKCAGKNKAKCEEGRRFIEGGRTRARLLLSNHPLRIIPCGAEFQTDGHGRTFAAIQLSEDRDYLTKMVEESWCARLETACAHPPN